MSTYAGKIQVRAGTSTDSYIREADLIANQEIYPEIREWLEYVDQRSLATLLVSGAVKPWGVDGQVSTDFAPISKGKDIGNSGFQFDIQGRIQKASVINSQIGATAPDGTFQLSLADDTIDPGMNVMFNGYNFQARCQARPTGSPGNFIYTFKTVDGSLFVWATHVAGQGTTKTCMGAYTSYGAGSLRGYSHSFFPDRFINHMTTQRATVKMDGDTQADKLWLTYSNDKGTVKGWMYKAIAQQMARSVIEDEIQKWFGVSSMKDSNGGSAVRPNIQDAEAQSDLIQGDGVLEQLSGGNELFGSGTSGNPTEDDYEDMMKLLEKNSNSVTGMTWVGITGTDGFANAQRVCTNLAGNQGVNLQQVIVQSPEAGGAKVDIGFNYQRFNINGNSITFIKHPKFDDDQLFTEKGSDGKSLMSSMVVILNLGTGMNKNIEILNKGGNGLSRGTVDAMITGLTGEKGATVQSEEDASKYATLKQDLILVYNSSSCGVLKKAR